ncbi:Utp8p SCDLUD_002380 [Saccharomycodes ludwigii]|uniref:Utp8p n=1 Tax=Saccharomycodes ludwigii TaxID=36035 RepID=UPI001E846B2F|nr:hypothetical protein SCDLUD_002380 [Saccharomycodes ludwigii]KAH3900920.1 hypothetical protein SCDLUD_002380 [Saccharomycodes ludwigii]
MTCSISQSFRIAALPKIASLNNFSKQTTYLQLTESSPVTEKSNFINIGISGSSLSQFIINPTPKLVFNHSIPSTNTVTAFDVLEIEDQPEHVDEQTDGTINSNVSAREYWVYGLLANNKVSTLNFFTRTLNNNSTSDGVEPDSSNNTTTKVTTLKVDSKIVDLKILNKNSTIILIVFDNGLIQLRDLKNIQKIVYSIDTLYECFNYSAFFVENDKTYLFTLSRLKPEKNNSSNTGIVYKLFNIDCTHHTIIELNTIVIEDFNIIEEINKKFYNNGKYYQLNSSDKAIEIYQLPNFQFKAKIDVSNIFLDIYQGSNQEEGKQEDITKKISFKPVASSRCLLTVKNEIFLLDLQHQTLLTKRELSGNIETFQILQAGVISGSSKSSDSNTIALGVSTKHGSNPSSYLDIVNINVGNGSLRESLGKSFSLKRKESCGDKFASLMCPLFQDTNGKDEKDSVLVDFNKALKALGNLTNDPSKFDETFFQVLKINQNGYYMEDTDRFINNPKFISELVDTVLNSFIAKKISTKSFTYLLTHPYFPRTKTIGLLDRLRFDSRLFKQCIVTCPGLKLDELLEELFTIKNDELLLDLSLRILQDFSKDEIIKSIKQVSRVTITNFLEFIIKRTDSTAEEEEEEEEDDDVDISKDKLKAMPQLLQFLSLCLDSFDIFQLELSFLLKLNKFITEEISLVETNNDLLNLLSNNDKLTNKSAFTFTKEYKNDVVEYFVETLKY